MQYTSKIALLAIALFGTSALAAPFADEAEFEVEAREVDDDLSAREFYDAYVEARADLSLDARDLESLDLEAREYLEYLEEREAATAATLPQTPLSAHSTSVEAHSPTHADATEKHVFLTKHQKSQRAAKKAAAKKFKNLQVYHNALMDEDSKLHHFAVLKYLSKTQNLKKALANKKSPYYKTAKRVLHRHRAKAYLAHKKNYKKALKHKSNKFHGDAVKMYLSEGKHFKNALTHKHSHFHAEAVHEYLLDSKTRQKVLADEHHPFYKQAVKLQKKINKLHKKHSKSSSTHTSTSTTATATKA